MRCDPVIVWRSSENFNFPKEIEIKKTNKIKITTIMKKILAIAAIAALTLTLASCNQNEIIETPVEDAISMSAFTPVATKSAVLSGTSLNPFSTDFIVNAYQGNTKFMNNVDIRYTTSWDYASASDKKYWPNDESKPIDFYAYAPASNNSMAVAADGKSMTVTVPEANADQKDILYAETLGCTKSDRNGTTYTEGSTEKVPLVFKHALSQINFAFKCTNSNIKVTVTKVAIENVANQVSETFAGVATTGASSVLTDYAAALNETSYVLGETAVNVTSANPMILAPQVAATTAWNKQAADATGSRFAITCKIEDVTSHVVYYDAIAYIPASFAWEAGKNYTYTFNFSTGAGQTPSGENILQVITFDPSVEAWSNVSSDVTM